MAEIHIVLLILLWCPEIFFMCGAIANFIEAKSQGIKLTEHVPFLFFVGLSVFWLLILLPMTFIAVPQYYSEEDYKQTFSPYLNEYIALEDECEKESSNPCISGQAIIVNAQEEKISSITFDFLFPPTKELKEKLKEKKFPIAQKPGEVDTIVLLKQYKSKEGEYTDGTSAYVVCYSISIIHKTECEVSRIYKCGDDPPETKISHVDVVMDPDILEYLITLPRC
ncbi:hypothetical protein BEH94_07895 [Candidatus Altiarchaeales archaeon WOR_SM1_SCG]|nr:hypothetical protein BEH94_07895 [Candidatus Altiarchaeales archaeon WOR_SM1_SCG]